MFASKGRMIHHITEEDFADWEMKMDCMDGPMLLHHHYLRVIDKIELDAIKNHDAHRWRRSRGSRDTRIWCKCEHHLLLMIHYFRCSKYSGGSIHKRQIKHDGAAKIPMCDGHNCANYRDELRKRLGIEDGANCDGCKATTAVVEKAAAYYRSTSVERSESSMAASTRNGPAAIETAKKELEYRKYEEELESWRDDLDANANCTSSFCGLGHTCGNCERSSYILRNEPKPPIGYDQWKMFQQD